MVTRLQFALAVWFTGLSVMQGALVQLSRPVVALAAPMSWPEETALARDPARKTMVAFLHPRCSCARGTVSELAEILAVAGPKVRASIVLAGSAGGGAAGAERSELETQARAVPGVRVRIDENNAEAQRFGVAGCGQVLVFTPGGHLLYAGGIRGDIRTAVGVGPRSSAPAGYRLANRRIR